MSLNILWEISDGKERPSLRSAACSCLLDLCSPLSLLGSCWSMQGTGLGKPTRAIGLTPRCCRHHVTKPFLKPVHLLKAAMSPLGSGLAAETNSTLSASSHKSGLRGHPSDPALHISCFGAISLPDRWQVSHLSGYRPQYHGLSDGFMAVRVSAPALLPSSACTRRCWGRTATRHPPCACSIPLVHVACLTPKETPTRGVSSSIWETPESHEILRACKAYFSLGQGREGGEGGGELLPVASNDGKCLTEHKVYGVIPLFPEYTVIPNASYPLASEGIWR